MFDALTKERIAGALTVTATWADGKLVVAFNRPLMNADAAAVAENITLTVDGAAPAGTWTTSLDNHAGTPGVSAVSHGFTDVSAGDWYSDAVAWAYENGVAMGYSDEIFAPDDSITRERIVVILHRYAQMLEIDVSETADIAGFTDADTVSDWAFDAMTWAYAIGLILGRTETTIAPDGTATRAEVATLLMRFTENQ